MSYCLYVYCIKIGMDPIDGGGGIILKLFKFYSITREENQEREGKGKNIKLDGTLSLYLRYLMDAVIDVVKQVDG